MKNQRKRLLALIAMMLACVMLLPVFSACGKEETPVTTAEEVFQEEQETVPPATSKTPEVTKSNPNAESLQSTPNKGGNKKVTSGTNSEKSKYSAEQEALAQLDVNAAKTVEDRRNYAEAYMRAMLTVEWTLQERPDTQKSTNKSVYNKDKKTTSTSEGEKTFYLHDYADEEAWEKAIKAYFTTSSTKEVVTEAYLDADEYTYKVGYDGTKIFYLKAGEIYRGLPFSQGSSGIETFNLLVKEKNADGVCVMDTRLDTYYLYGGPGLVGNTYDTALIYAWNTVSYTSRAQAASNMVPRNGYYFVEGVKLPELTEEERQAAASKPPIPDHNGDLIGAGVAEKLYDYIDDGSLSGDTDDIVAFNGEQGMYAAYANAKKADGLVKCDGSTDAKMVVSVSVVKNPDGSIDGEQSKIVILAQTGSLKTVTEGERTVHCFGEVDAEYTFKQLFDGHYVPMTVKELVDGTLDTGDAMVRDQYEYSSYRTGSYLYKGIINGSRRILWVNTVVEDAEGKVLFNNTAFAEKKDILLPGATETGRYTFDLGKLDDSQEKITSLGDDVISNSTLGKGTFHYKVTAHMITGEDIVVRDYTYTNK